MVSRFILQTKMLLISHLERSALGRIAYFPLFSKLALGQTNFC
jgi:hypothetical protein